MKKHYKIVINNKTKTFNNYYEAKRWLSETKKNWLEQINEMEWNEERAKLCQLYWETKIEVVFL